MVLIKNFDMTATVVPTIKDQELISFGSVESASVNSINDFTPSKLKESLLPTDKEKEEFANTFICHLIFYAVFCVSLVLHILIDLGLGSFLKNKFFQLIGLRNKTVFTKNLAFA